MQRNPERGMTLIELMISMVMLAVGLGALTTMLVIAIASNSRNGKDSTATMLAQTIIEQVAAESPNGNQQVTITDCQGTVWNVSTVDAAPPNGSGATLTPNGNIDQTQAWTAIPAGYSMQYVDCAANGPQTTYDVRWNVMTLAGTNTRLITASARPIGSNSNQLGGVLFALPVTLRSVGGS